MNPSPGLHLKPLICLASLLMLTCLPGLSLAEHHGGDADAGEGAPAPAPLVVVDSLQVTLLDYMRAAAANEGRVAATEVEALDKSVLATHDFPYIARIVLGRSWRSLEDGDRERFIEHFTALSLATYASRFAEFDGESFSVIDESDGSFGQRKVSATLSTTDKEHSFDYLLREKEGQWRIVNIIVDGVSDLALKRAEYSTLMASGGFEELLAELERQRAALADEASG